VLLVSSCSRIASRQGSNTAKPWSSTRHASLRPAGHGRSSVFPLVLGAELFELCPHRRNAAFEDINDLVANFGRRENGSVYKSTPTIDLILGSDDYLIGIAIHGHEALRFLNLLHQIIDSHGLGLHFVQFIGRSFA
jgi:hypothetical protein